MLDLAGSTVLLLVAAPILLAVAVVLRLQLGRGVVLTQHRVGRDGRVFELYKFRTMARCRRETSHRFDGPERRMSHKTDDDPRHTSIGRVVRRFSLDELPQLLNVVRGDMSLVGPRPELASVATAHFIAHPRHRVRPGLTGPYQVSDLRFTGLLEPGLPLDIDYVDDIRLTRDLRLLAATASSLARGTGS